MTEAEKQKIISQIEGDDFISGIDFGNGTGTEGGEHAIHHDPTLHTPGAYEFNPTGFDPNYAHAGVGFGAYDPNVNMNPQMYMQQQ